jgi:hypothetical protein
MSFFGILQNAHMTLAAWHRYIKKKKCDKMQPKSVENRLSPPIRPSLSVEVSRYPFFSRGKPTTLQRDNTKNSKQIFLEKELRCLSPVSTFMFLWTIYIFSGSVCLFCCRKICGQILGTYKLLIDI